MQNNYMNIGKLTKETVRYTLVRLQTAYGYGLFTPEEKTKQNKKLAPDKLFVLVEKTRRSVHFPR